MVEDLELDQHVTRLRLPAPGSHRQLMDAVGAFADTPLDPARPLWSALLVGGLEGGGAAYAVTIHQSVTDGVGAVRLMGLLHSHTAKHDPDRPEPPVPAVASRSRSIGIAARLSGLVGGVMAAFVDRSPGDATLLGGRGGARRVEVVEVPLAALRAGAAAAGGSVHDGFVAAVLHGLTVYHRWFGVDSTVSLGVPIGLGAQDGANGHLAGAVVDVPLGDEDPVERVRAARELVLSAEASGSRRADVQVASLPGIGHPVYLAGSRITRLFPLGPLGGCAATITLVAHDGIACVGIVMDDAAVTEPDLLVDGVRAGLVEVLALAMGNP